MNKEVRETIADLEQQGWKFTRTAKGHWRGKHPDAPRKILHVSGSASDWRAGANIRADARRLVS